MATLSQSKLNGYRDRNKDKNRDRDKRQETKTEKAVKRNI